MPMDRWRSFQKDLKVLWASVWGNTVVFAIVIVISTIAINLVGGFHFRNIFPAFIQAVEYAFSYNIASSDEGFWLVIISIMLPIFTFIIFVEGFLRTFSLFLSRHSNKREWNKKMATLYKDHYLILGIGEMGKAIVSQIIERDAASEIILVDIKESVGAQLEDSYANLCFILGDITTPGTRRLLNLDKAKMIFITTGNDVLNLTLAMDIANEVPNKAVWARLKSSQLLGLIDEARFPNLHVFCPFQGAAVELFRSMDEKIMEKR